MVYDPTLEGHDREGRTYNVAIDSGLAHPDVTLVLDCDDPNYPAEALNVIRSTVPGAELAETEPDALLAQIRRLLSSTSG